MKTMAMMAALLLGGACAHRSTGPKAVPFEGSVRDTKNQPIRRVVVTISPYSAGSADDEPQCVTTTDSKGEFKCTSLDGKPFQNNKLYRVQVEKPGMKSLEYEVKYRPDITRQNISLAYEADLDEKSLPPEEIRDPDAGKVKSQAPSRVGQ
jgi:hypothetical protein